MLVLAAAMIVYWNSLSGEFVYDDHSIIVKNPLVRGQASPADILASSYWQRGEPVSSGVRLHDGLYRPMTIWSYSLNWRWGGGRPICFHVVNVILHGSVSVLLFWLMGLLGVSWQAAVFGAFAFVVLPIHVEAVSWVVGRAEILGAFFVLAAWLLLHQETIRSKIAAGLVCYALALLSKESAAPFPAALVLGEVFGHRGSMSELVRSRLLVWLQVFGVLLLYLSWRNSILGSVFFVGTPYFSTQSPMAVTLTMAKFLLRGWIWPMATGLGLCADYSRPGFPDAGVTDLTAWAALAAIIGVSVWAGYAFYRKRSAPAFAVLLFLCLAAPLLNIFVPMGILGAERIMYLPSIAFCLFISVIWDSMGRLGRMRDFWPRAIAAGCFLWWSALTVARNRVWRNDASLFKATAASMPDNPRVLTGLGIVADEAGRHADARSFYKRALEVEPNPVQAFYNIGKSYYDEGDWRSAKSWFEKLEKRSSADKDTLCFLGLIAEHEGRYREALDYYVRTLKRDPTHLEARRNIGLLLFKTGNEKESIRQLRIYLKDASPNENTADIEHFLRLQK